MQPGSQRTKAITLIELIIVVAIIVIIVAIVVFGMIEPPHTHNEIAAIGSLRAIASIQAQLHEGDGESRFHGYASSFEELSHVGLIDNILGSGSKGGYVFALSGGTHEWYCTATPMSDRTGTRNFIVCTDGVVRFSTSGGADCSSAAIQ
ncbi:MAG: hypothetical protein O7H41_07270 [Planctomycetota bacterium]|nr:hypothetical protein [Planctomycetota bacterium]